MYINKITLLLLTLTLRFVLIAQEHWESIILENDTFRYFEATSEPPNDWNQNTFNDASWKSGQGGIGYADDDDNTQIETVNSLYIRKLFSITDTSLIKDLLLDIDYDDAFVAYLNGTEIARSGNVIDEIPAYNGTLTVDHEASMYQGGLPERYKIDISFLNNVTNLIAIHILNVGINSSDLTSIIYLNAMINSESILFNPTPDWFYEPVTYESSNLPLIFINTFGMQIPYDHKIDGHMGIINNENGRNYLNDPFNGYDGFIGIDGRGSSSQMFDKKNYNIETRTDSGTNNNVELLGMPRENDWILHGPYSDKTLMRNALVYHLGSLTGRWAPRYRFCELYLNDQYYGVNVLIEKVKRDNDRLNIVELLPENITGDALTGGYLLKIDRPDPGSWTSPFPGINGINNIEISYEDPEWEELVQVQRDYIKNYITDFEYALHDEDFDDMENSYRAYIDMLSFVDYFIINELSKNVDGYRLSTFFYKDRDSRGGKLCMGPLWDYNLAFGNADYYECGLTTGWLVNSISPDDWFQIPFWWEKLREDPLFNSNLKKRWFSLRENQFSQANIFKIIDSLVNLLSEAQVRNFDQFPVFNQYIWPNNFIGSSYEEEINYMKDWIADRLTWIDNQLESIVEINGYEELLVNSYEIYAYPNPFTEKFTLKMNLFKSAKVNVSIYSISGQVVYEFTQDCQAGLNDLLIDLQHISGKGMFIYELKVNNRFITSDKIIKN